MRHVILNKVKKIEEISYKLISLSTLNFTSQQRYAEHETQLRLINKSWVTWRTATTFNFNQNVQRQPKDQKETVNLEKKLSVRTF